MRVPDQDNFVLLLGPRAVCTERYIQDTPVVTMALGSLADSVMGYGDPNARFEVFCAGLSSAEAREDWWFWYVSPPALRGRRPEQRL